MKRYKPIADMVIMALAFVVAAQGRLTMTIFASAVMVTLAIEDKQC